MIIMNCDETPRHDDRHRDVAQPDQLALLGDLKAAGLFGRRESRAGFWDLVLSDIPCGDLQASQRR